MMGRRLDRHDGVPEQVYPVLPERDRPPAGLLRVRRHPDDQLLAGNTGGAELRPRRADPAGVVADVGRGGPDRDPVQVEPVQDDPGQARLVRRVGVLMQGTVVARDVRVGRGHVGAGDEAHPLAHQNRTT
jgi:hypothetical protein